MRISKLYKKIWSWVMRSKLTFHTGHLSTGSQTSILENSWKGCQWNLFIQFIKSVKLIISSYIKGSGRIIAVALFLLFLYACYEGTLDTYLKQRYISTLSFSVALTSSFLIWPRNGSDSTTSFTQMMWHWNRKNRLWTGKIVYAPAERAGTLPLFLLYPYTRVWYLTFHLASSVVEP
jgi:hypothetical protein